MNAMEPEPQRDPLIHYRCGLPWSQHAHSKHGGFNFSLCPPVAQWRTRHEPLVHWNALPFHVPFDTYITQHSASAREEIMTTTVLFHESYPMSTPVFDHATKTLNVEILPDRTVDFVYDNVFGQKLRPSDRAVVTRLVSLAHALGRASALPSDFDVPGCDGEDMMPVSESPAP